MICPIMALDGILKLRRHLDTETYGRVANYKLTLKFRAKIKE